MGDQLIDQLRTWSQAFVRDPRRASGSVVWADDAAARRILERNRLLDYVDPATSPGSDAVERRRALQAEAFALFGFLRMSNLAGVQLKGHGLSSFLYGDPMLRTSGDLDVLVEPAGIQILHEWLLRRGYRQRVSVLGTDRDAELATMAPTWKPAAGLLSEYLMREERYQKKIEIQIFPHCLNFDVRNRFIMRLLGSRRLLAGVDVPDDVVGFAFFCLDKRKDFALARAFCLRDMIDLGRGFTRLAEKGRWEEFWSVCHDLGVAGAVGAVQDAVARLFPSLLLERPTRVPAGDEGSFAWIDWAVFADPRTDGNDGFVAAPCSAGIRLRPVSRGSAEADLGPYASARIRRQNGAVTIEIQLDEHLLNVARSIEVITTFGPASAYPHQQARTLLDKGQARVVQTAIFSGPATCGWEAGRLTVSIPVVSADRRAPEVHDLLDVSIYRDGQPLPGGGTVRTVVGGALNLRLDEFAEEPAGRPDGARSKTVLPGEPSARQRPKDQGPARRLLAPLSFGDLLDRITILEIKLANVADRAKRANVDREWRALRAVLEEQFPAGRLAGVRALMTELKAVNERLWTLEENVRASERTKVFNDGFVQMARSIYRTNDRRAALKREINEALGSEIREEKSHRP